MNHIETIQIVYNLACSNNNNNTSEFDRNGVFAGLVYLYSKLGESWMQQRIPSGLNEIHLDRMNKIAKRITMDEPLHFQLSRSMRLVVEILLRELLQKDKKRQDESRKRLEKVLKESIGILKMSIALMPDWFIGADFYYRCTINACKLVIGYPASEIDEWYPQRAQSVLGELWFTIHDPKKFEAFMYKYGVLDDLGNEHALALSVAVLEVMERFSLEDEAGHDPFYQNTSTLEIVEQTFLMKRCRLEKSLNTSRWIIRIFKESNKLRKLKYSHLIHLPRYNNNNNNSVFSATTTTTSMMTQPSSATTTPTIQPLTLTLTLPLPLPNMSTATSVMSLSNNYNSGLIQSPNLIIPMTNTILSSSSSATNTPTNITTPLATTFTSLVH
ncbi:hypothetical protein PPL_03325 [Heterostelium album PN500]|uniref:Uncharacterized protein n=1 Tax=Heterostelium pallidum (strain ATCC 26659 / Pp 5 / PN500) TaxID=670386 RepID=D3B4K0_HETP5|nr:hypothetical protein PPL_03325 [Heterostelium album PN500]EFA84248.1 hypothetical protein PPL_03325 [Heterostelium album PN500]|eukprot:XP_020436364.1 hypothetical protein PPL_03325 [Heterostelium album PN500]